MSPASAGAALQVERYIGACLISSYRHDGAAYPPPGYAGMPLISFMNHRRRPQEGLSPLAIHTQGAPLIRKDYKPRNNKNKFVNHNKVDSVSVASDESNSSENCLPRIIKPRKRRKKERKPQRVVDVDVVVVPEVEPYREEVPRLHHSFDEVEGSDDALLPGDTSSCQCRYCDPSGQIWDVDRRCYSPFLTVPNRNSSYSLFSFDAECLADRMAAVSVRSAPSATSGGGGDLEVSTEIVTSLNGHRDLEIKFFSASSDAGSAKHCDNSSSGDDSPL